MKKTLLKVILNILSKTWRIELVGEIPQAPKVVAFWHNEMLAIWRYFSGNNFSAVVSLSKDGEILSYLLSSWKYKLIRGSSSKKGNEVLEQMIEATRETSVFITPDGPRGPRHKMKAGAFIAAQRGQVPIFFLRCETSAKKQFHKSWDKFEFPLPFASIKIKVIDTFVISKDMTKDEINALIISAEEKMTAK